MVLVGAKTLLSKIITASPLGVLEVIDFFSQCVSYSSTSPLQAWAQGVQGHVIPANKLSGCYLHDKEIDMTFSLPDFKVTIYMSPVNKNNILISVSEYEGALDHLWVERALFRSGVSQGTIKFEGIPLHLKDPTRVYQIATYGNSFTISMPSQMKS